jgi:hypothetical protein
MGIKIRVPESVGDEVAVTYGHPDKGTVRYAVTDGVVEVAEDDVDTFLRSVAGAETAESPAPRTKAEK